MNKLYYSQSKTQSASAYTRPDSMEMQQEQNEERKRYKSDSNTYGGDTTSHDSSCHSYGDEDAEYEKVERLQIRWEKIQPERKPYGDEMCVWLQSNGYEMYDILNKLWSKN